MIRIKNVLYIFLGFFFIFLGGIGIIIPILPTTPFFLLALFFFTKSSKKFELWFKNTKLYTKYLEDFVNKRSMTLKSKIQLLLFASIMLLVAIYFVKLLWARIIILFLITFKYYYFIFKIKTIKNKQQ